MKNIASDVMVTLSITYITLCKGVGCSQLIQVFYLSSFVNTHYCSLNVIGSMISEWYNELLKYWS